MWRCCVLFLVIGLIGAEARLDNQPDKDTKELDAQNKYDSEGDDDWTSGGDDNQEEEENSSEHIGASVTQVLRHPYAATLQNNNTYICSAVILNTFWLITDSKCFNSHIISSYVTKKNLTNYSMRVGSSYNNKGGSLYKISTLINNFDLKVTAVKLKSPLEFDDRVRAVNLPQFDEEANIGYLSSIVAWTPVGHMRVVNAPLIDSNICDSYTKLLPGHYICVGGVVDVNRKKFCRRDNGGAVVQNNTLIGLSSFIHECAIYTRTHAFPKVSSFARWLDSVIWDENNRPTTTVPPVTNTKPPTVNVTENPNDTRSPYFSDPRKFMLTLPFDPINVPLEPSGDNSVINRMSLYESYLRNMARAKTSTTVDPKVLEELKQSGIEKEWMKKYGNAVMMMPPQLYSQKRYEINDYNK